MKRNYLIKDNSTEKIKCFEQKITYILNRSKQVYYYVPYLYHFCSIVVKASSIWLYLNNYSASLCCQQKTYFLDINAKERAMKSRDVTGYILIQRLLYTLLIKKQLSHSKFARKILFNTIDKDTYDFLINLKRTLQNYYKFLKIYFPHSDIGAMSIYLTFITKQNDVNPMETDNSIQLLCLLTRHSSITMRHFFEILQQYRKNASELLENVNEVWCFQQSKQDVSRCERVK